LAGTGGYVAANQGDLFCECSAKLILMADYQLAVTLFREAQID